MPMPPLPTGVGVGAMGCSGVSGGKVGVGVIGCSGVSGGNVGLGGMIVNVGEGGIGEAVKVGSVGGCTTGTF